MYLTTLPQNNQPLKTTNLYIGEPSDEHHPLLVSRELVEEGTMRDPQVFQGGELPQLVHLGPVLDLGGGDVEGVEAGWELRKSLCGRQLGHWALCQRKELQPWNKRKSDGGKEILCGGGIWISLCWIYLIRVHFGDAVPCWPTTALSRSWQFENKHRNQIMAKKAPHLL